MRFSQPRWGVSQPQCARSSADPARHPPGWPGTCRLTVAPLRELDARLAGRARTGYLLQPTLAGLRLQHDEICDLVSRLALEMDAANRLGTRPDVQVGRGAATGWGAASAAGAVLLHAGSHGLLCIIGPALAQRLLALRAAGILGKRL